jgi:metal-sulfur cluster biosynthetic enzyme
MAGEAGAAVATAVGEADVLAALAVVRDPELDESLLALGFVSRVEVQGGRVAISLRLPTYFCAPNFSYLMVADARREVGRLPGVEAVEVELEDHFAAAEINGAVAADTGFEGAFPGETEGSLEELRELFRRKALLARQSRVAEGLRRDGASFADLAALTVADLPGGEDARRSLELRAELGLPHATTDPALLRPDGSPLAAAEMERWLRSARLVRLSLEGNGGLCRGLLRTRYGIPDPEEVAA